MASFSSRLPLPTGKVLACIDASRYAESVFDHALWCADRMEAPLSLLHVLDAPAGGTVEPRRNLAGTIGFGARERLLEELATLDEQRARLAMEQGRLLLAAAAERAEAAGGRSVETRQRHGSLADALLALESETRMVVMGKRGAESAPTIGHLGANLERVIRTVGKPVLVTPQSFVEPERIMFAYDGSPTAHKGVAMVAASPLFRGIPCHLVYAGADRPDIREALEKASGFLQEAGFEAPFAILPEGPAEEVIPRYQVREKIDLLIMGAYGHSRIRHLILGSTTTALLRTCTTALIVLR